MIPLARPTLDEEEARAATAVLRSGMLVSGEQVERFEALVAARVGRRHAVAVSSGTAALSLALSALDVGEGDEVLVPDLTWPSPAHAVIGRGARPILSDVDLAEWNVTGPALTAARTARTGAAIVIDQLGNAARRAEVEAALAGLPIIEDAACALGSRFADGTPCGSLGVVSCFSFHPRKVVTTGEGGMCVTDDDAIAARLRVLRNHGQATPGEFIEAAENHRLTEMAAAIGIVQMGRLDAIVERRRTLAARYEEALPATLLHQRAPAGSSPNHQTYGLLLPEGAGPADRDRAVEALRERGVGAGRLSYALHRLPVIAQAAGAKPDAFPASASIVDRGLALPLFPRMTDAEQSVVVEEVQRVLGEATT